MSQTNDTPTLPGDDYYQTAILGHLLTNKPFFLQASRRIIPAMFQNPLHRKIYQLLLNQFKETKVFPNLAELKAFHEWRLLDQPEMRSLHQQIDIAAARAGNVRVDVVKPELISWMRSKVLFDAIKSGADLYNKKNFKELASRLGDAVNDYHDCTFDDGIAISFDNPKDWIKGASENQVEALGTGLKLLDKALLDRPEINGKSGGGYQLGDTTVILAPSNTGKTTTLITMACHNVREGKPVLFMSHEGRPEDLRMKMVKCMLRVTEQELFAMYRDPVGLAKIEAATSLLKQFMTYIPFNKAGMRVEEVMPIIQRAQEDRVAHAKDGYKLLVSDYPAKLTTDLAMKGNLSMRHVQDIVYENYVQIALEYNWHSLVAIQTNREGSKVNNGQYDKFEGAEHRLLGMEDVSEAWGPMTSASNVITLNRSPAAKHANRMTFYVAKSRSSETGMAVVARTRFDCSVSHGDDLGATSYFGTATMETEIETHLAAYKDGRIPIEVVQKSAVKLEGQKIGDEPTKVE